MNYRELDTFGRIRLSKNFFMRDFLFSEIAHYYGMLNVPDDPDLAIEAGRHLCVQLLEPLQEAFGRIAIRSGYRSCAVNHFGNRNLLGCASNEANYAAHIWDRRDEQGYLGATACVVIPSFLDHYEATGDWQALAWWIHDHLPYSEMTFFAKQTAFNLRWHEKPNRTINSYVAPFRGCLTKPGMANHAGSHASLYGSLPGGASTSD
jgi:hypothetical protein